MENSELAPCYRCGSWITPRIKTHEETEEFYVSCSGCRCQGPQEVELETAVEKWRTMYLDSKKSNTLETVSNAAGKVLNRIEKIMDTATDPDKIERFLSLSVRALEAVAKIKSL